MRLSAALSYFAFCGMAFLIVFNLGPLLETKFNPVFSKFQIVNVDPHPNGVDIPNLHAETFSRCHPFWVTRSEIYP